MKDKGQLGDLVKTKVTALYSDGLITSSRVWLEVKDVMNRDVLTITSNETVVSAAKIMSENKVSCIIVVDNGSAVGIITEKGLLAKVANRGNDYDKITVAETMSSCLESIPANLSVFDASKIMEDKDLKQLIALEQKNFVGIVTQTDLTRAFTLYGTWEDVTEIMNSNVATVSTKATVAEAVAIMKSHNISCIVAMEGNKIHGIFTDKDFLKKIVVPQKNPNDFKVEQVMSSPVMMIPPSHSILSAYKVMDKMRLHRLVVAEDDQLRGIITQTDVFRAMKKTLLEEEEKNLKLLELSESNIFTLDLDNKVTYINPAFMKLFEISDKAELINQHFLPERFWIFSEERTKCLEKLKNGHVEINDLVLKTSKGKILYSTFFSTFSKNIHGQINGTQGVFNDTTDRELAKKSAELSYKELEKAHQELKETQSQVVQSEKLASIGQLAAGVAHEVNTPVGFVASNFQTLEGYLEKIKKLLGMYDELTTNIETLGKDELLDKASIIGQSRGDMNMDFVLEDIEELFSDSKEGLERVTSIVQNLRDFSRSGRTEDISEYSLNNGIETTLIVAKNEIKYDANVKTEFSEIPLICCASGQINQVFLNILLNAAQAIRYQEKEGMGNITIRTYAIEDEVICEISDDGPGIAPDKLSQIFDPFFTTKPAGKGTGLGLSVSYDIIVNKHKGKLLVESTVGEGTKFIIKLPIEEESSDKQKLVDNGNVLTTAASQQNSLGEDKD